MWFWKPGEFREASISLGRIIVSGSPGGQWRDTGSLTEEHRVAKLGSCSELPYTGSYFFYWLTHSLTHSARNTLQATEMFPLWTRIHCIYSLEGTFVILPISSILGHETLFLLLPFTPPFSLRLASQTTAKNRQSGHQPPKYSIQINKYIKILFLTVVLFLKYWYHNYSLHQNSISVAYIRCGNMQEPLNTLNES